jgi:sec-independent protein translocase protein TatA
MLGNAFGWPHLLIILAVILLLFGATKLPALAKSIGQSMKVFRNEMKTDDSKGPESAGESTESTKDSAPSDKS